MNGIGALCSEAKSGSQPDGCPSELFCKRTDCKVNPVATSACEEPQREGTQCDSDFNAAKCLPCEPGTTCVGAGFGTVGAPKLGVCKKPCATAADCPCDNQSPPRECKVATGTDVQVCTGCAPVGGACEASSLDTSHCCGTNKQACGTLKVDGISKPSTCCIGVGGKCDPKSTNDDCCTNEGACASDGLCRKHCELNADCPGAERCDCAKKICEPSPPLGVPCKSTCDCGRNATCFINNATGNGSCVESCAGTGAVKCATGLVCLGGACVSPPARGTPCINDVQCNGSASGLLCSSVTHACEHDVCHACNGQDSDCAQKGISQLYCTNLACCITQGSPDFKCTSTEQCCPNLSCSNGACVTPKSCMSNNDCGADQTCEHIGDAHVCSATADALQHKTACLVDYGGGGGPGCNAAGATCTGSDDCCDGTFCDNAKGSCSCKLPNQACDDASSNDVKHPQCCTGKCIHHVTDGTFNKGHCGTCKEIGDECDGGGAQCCPAAPMDPEVACVRFDINGTYRCTSVSPSDACAGSGQFCRFQGLPTGNAEVTIKCCPDPGGTMTTDCPPLGTSNLCP